MMDNLAEQMLTGGGLLYGAGRAEAKRGSFDKANAYQTLGDIQSANYQRDTAVKAAEAGRSQVTINNGHNQSSSQSAHWTYTYAKTFPNGNKYEGQWKDDVPDGHGTMIVALTGESHTGEWKAGSPNGHGTRIWLSGNKCEGEWRDGAFIQGTYTYTNGDIYVGNFLNGKRNGHGIYTSHDGTISVGEWRDNRFVNGKKTSPNGTTCEGGFRDGKLDGVGKMTYADGRIEDGIWRDGIFIGAQTQANKTSQSPQSDNNLKTGFVNIAAADASFDVYADGAFVGNSPARLKLSEGSHVIEVKKTGFKDYRKEIKVMDGSELNLKAVLENN